MEFILRRLTSGDYQQYLNLRIEGFQKHPMQFRYSPEDEYALSKATILNKLDSDYVVGIFSNDSLVGIGGLGQFPGSKLKHRSLIWGMYIAEPFRSKGLSKRLLSALLSQARILESESLLLTVVSHNDIAISLYKKFGFIHYATDKNAIKLSEGNYLDEVLMVKSLI